ncbi:MAG: hypothetical protein R3C10_25060 [Pirellulales bacterium]
MAATLSSVVILIGMLWAIIHEGAGWLSWNFLTNYTSVHPEKAGILSALVGSLWLIGLTAVFSVVVGVGAAVYLEEYARDSWFKRLVQLNISNLAGVPSIVYGILGLVLFVRGLSSVTGGRSVLSGVDAHTGGVADCDHCLARGTPRGTQDDPPGLLCLGGHALADGLAPRAPGGDARHDDRRDPFTLAGLRRGGR